MPKAILYSLLIIFFLLLIPPAIVAMQRATLSEQPRLHLIQDMDNQARFKTQQVNPLFQDDRAMRPVVDGAVDRDDVIDDPHYTSGIVGDDWAATFPDQIEINERFLQHGRERYDVFCALCHGYSGYGNGMIHQRAQLLVEGGVNGTTWVAPKSLHDPTVVGQPVGQLYNTITHGVRNMAGYKSQIPVADRWAIVGYILALQRAQQARVEDLPEGVSPDELPRQPLPEPTEPDEDPAS